MAWTTPRDWTGISDDIVTAAMLNVDVRDNLAFLGVHSHTGAAGMGLASMSGLTLAALVTMTFADQSANPDAAGELQRNGNDLLFYGSSVVNLTAADASAGTASLRTLGTTSVKAAAGDHTHVPATQAVGLSEDGNSGVIDHDDEVTLSTVTATPGAAGRAWIVYGTLVYAAESTNTYTGRLKFDSTTLETRTGLTGVVLVMAGFQASPSVGSHTVTVTSQRTIGGASFRVRGGVGFREVSA
jgi:hypothetical protein